MNNQFEGYSNIPKEKFALANRSTSHDLKFDTKPVSYLRDAFRRFSKNKASVVGAIIIAIIILYAIFAPIFSPYQVSDRDGRYKNTLPKLQFMEGTGIWDGSKEEIMGQANYDYYSAITLETGKPAIVLIDELDTVSPTGVPEKKYKVRKDSYLKVGVILRDLTNEEYLAIQEFQNETGRQVLYPMITTNDSFLSSDGNYWYKTDNMRGGMAVRDANGDLISKYLSYNGTDQYNSIRIEGETPLYRYATRMQGDMWRCRLDYSEYYYYLNGHSAAFIFGSNEQGQDIFSALASGARLSLLLAVFVSTINLMLGAIYGSIAGYFGGVLDLVMERITDVLISVPFIIVVTLFKLHVSDIVGPFVSLLFAYVLTGWIGTGSSVRMQFYRYKHQEYILAARTLGAKNARIMIKHIFPNSLGTLITGSVLVIPGVIFGESSLSFLGIINLETGNLTSVGTLLSNGQGSLQDYPHIVMFPALFIALLMICFNLFGNGLRDAFNPSLRGVEE